MRVQMLSSVMWKVPGTWPGAGATILVESGRVVEPVGGVGPGWIARGLAVEVAAGTPLTGRTIGLDGCTAGSDYSEATLGWPLGQL